MPFWHFRLSTDALLIMQCPKQVSKVHDGNFQRSRGEGGRGVYGWFLHFWRLIQVLPPTLKVSVGEVWGEKSCAKLREVSFYGHSWNSVEIHCVRKGNKGRKIKDRVDLQPTYPQMHERCTLVPWPNKMQNIVSYGASFYSKNLIPLSKTLKE